MALPILGALTAADLDAAMVIERQVFQQPWGRHMYLTDLKHNRRATYLAVRPSPVDLPTLPPVLAYGGLWLIAEDAHIATIASHPDWRGCGLGQYLLLALMGAGLARGAQRSTLEVRVGNLSAQRLYLKLGYETVGVRRRYYQDGEDALIMATPPLSDPAMQTLVAAQTEDAVRRMAGCFANER